MYQDIALAIARGDDGRYLVARRRDDAAHLPGFWEFPGGKPLPGEALDDCAVREMREELGIEVIVTRALPPITHDYGQGRAVRLHPFLCRIEGERQQPQALECAEWRWLAPADLPALRWPDANRSLVAALTAGG